MTPAQSKQSVRADSSESKSTRTPVRRYLTVHFVLCLMVIVLALQRAGLCRPEGRYAFSPKNVPPRSPITNRRPLRRNVIGRNGQSGGMRRYVTSAMLVCEYVRWWNISIARSSIGRGTLAMIKDSAASGVTACLLSRPGHHVRVRVYIPKTRPDSQRVLYTVFAYTWRPLYPTPTYPRI